MSNSIKIPLRSLNPEIIKDLQEKYPEAEIKVERSQDKAHSPLSHERFWEIIDLLDWEKESNDDAVLEPAIAQLSEGSVRHIFEFADILSEKLHALDQKSFAQNIGEDAWQPDKYFSVDYFLYARCCVVANGKAIFEKVLNDPTQMPKDITFEGLLYLASMAYERKMGRTLAYTPTFPIETYSNKQGWK